VPEPPAGVKDGRDVVCAYVSGTARHGARSAKRYRVAVSVVKAPRGNTRRPLVILGGGLDEAVAHIGPLIAGRQGRKALFGRLSERRRASPQPSSTACTASRRGTPRSRR
jgi:hypothetical protein